MGTHLEQKLLMKHLLTTFIHGETWKLSQMLLQIPEVWSDWTMRSHDGSTFQVLQKAFPTAWHLFKMVAFSMLNNRSFQYFIRSTILWASLKVVESGNGRKRKGVCALEMHLLSWTLPFKQTNSEELDMKTEKGGGFHLWKEASFLLCHSFPPYVMTAPFNYTFQEHENI